MEPRKRFLDSSQKSHEREAFAVSSLVEPCNDSLSSDEFPLSPGLEEDTLGSAAALNNSAIGESDVDVDAAKMIALREGRATVLSRQQSLANEDRNELMKDVYSGLFVDT